MLLLVILSSNFKNILTLAEFTRSNSTSSLNGLGQNENENSNKLSRDCEFKAPLREQNCLSTDKNTISACEETGNNSQESLKKFLI